MAGSRLGKRMWLAAFAGMTCVNALGTPAAQAFDPTLVPVFADRIVVKKKDRRLLLYKEDVTLASYPVSLGRQPRGHKREQGDSRTPEGRYLIDWRKPDSDFHLALH